MRKLLSRPGLRYILIANMISMFGSGMNTAAVTWSILQATHSEVNLAWLAILQTIPSMLLLPFGGVVIDRQDRRYLVMGLDTFRAIIILTVAVLALTHRVQLWHLYFMNILVTIGFWMFWPTLNALIQELTPDDELVNANTLVMAGIQGGWLIAGSLVGFLYDKIGLGGVLIIDVCTYVLSFLFYFAVRSGKQVVVRPPDLVELEHKALGAAARYFHDMVEGVRFIVRRPAVLQMSISWLIFLGVLLSTSIITAPLSDRILNAGARGYGYLNFAWGSGAFLVALLASAIIARKGAHWSVALSFAVLSVGMFLVPFSHYIIVAMTCFLLMGACRSLCGIAISSDMMRLVPKHIMGRTQNSVFLAGMVLQLFLSWTIGWVAHHYSLSAAIIIIGFAFLVAFILTLFNTPGKTPAEAGGGIGR